MNRAKVALAGVSALAVGAALGWALVGALDGAEPAADPSPSLGSAIWFERSLDVLLQGFILVAGAFAVLLLLRKQPGGAKLD